MLTNVETATAAGMEDLPEEGGQNRWLALAVIWLIFAVHGADRSMVQVLLEPIRKYFSLNDSEAGLLAGLAYALPFAIAGIPIGILADHVRRTYLLAILVAAWSLMTVLCGLAPGFLLLLLARAGVGAAEAGGSPTMLSLLGDIFGPKSRPMALSLYFTAPLLGGMAGFILAGLIGGAHGWRAAMLCLGGPGIAVAGLAAFVLREPARGRFTPAHHAQALSVPALEALRYALEDRSIMLLTAAIIMACFTGVAVAGWVSVLLERVFSMSPQRTGIATAFILGLPSAVGLLGGGAIITRLRVAPAVFCGIVLLIAAPLGSAAALSPSPRAALIMFALWTLFAQAYIGAGFSALTSAIPPVMRGTLMATILVLSNLIGAGLGAQSTGLLSDLLHHWHDPASLQHAMAALALLNFLSAALFFSVRDSSTADKDV